MGRSPRFGVLVVGGVLMAAVLSLGVGASEAGPASGGGPLTISLLTNSNNQPGFEVLIPNFERVYPNIRVNATFAISGVLGQLETTELAAGNAPDLLFVNPGCGTPVSVCVLAKAGYLAPMVKKPWVKRTLPLVTSLSKAGQGLFGFEPIVTPVGMFTNDALFARLGLRVPQTFEQFLGVCQRATATGTAAMILPGAAPVSLANLLVSLAVATVYGKDAHWNAELKAGTVSFAGSPGWRQALQEFIEMNSAGCFQPGATGTTFASAEAQFAQGQGLMLAGGNSGSMGNIDAAGAQFSLSFYPYPGGTSPDQTMSYLHPAGLVSVNAHSSAQNQAAAQTFVDFLARPKQDALYAQINGALTQDEFLKGQLPAFMSSFAPVFANHRYVVEPYDSWWNASVLLALQQNAIGVITGQSSIDDILNAMDAAWKQGPA